MHSRFTVGVSLLAVVAVEVMGAQGVARAADPAPPAGPHPRLFLTSKVLTALGQLAKTPGTATANFASTCSETVTNAKDYTTRGGADGNNWPRAAVACAFAYMVDPQPMYAQQAIKYWVASMEDDQTLGDKLGCTAGVDPNWQTWNGITAAPKVILTVTHDTGYPIRWYAPFIALTYDWLHDAPGVSEALRAQTRVCLQSWVDYYTKSGYHNTEAGSNYNAGFVFGKTLAAIALAGENGANSDRLWSETINDLFQKLLVGEGLSGSPDTVGAPAGVMLGGDWGEGWQYGPLSVLEYALATRAVEEAGVPLPEMDAWTNSLIVRYVQATVPHLDGHYAGGDFEATDRVYAWPNAGILGAVLAGPSSDRAAAWARSMMTAQKLAGVKTPHIGDVLAEARDVTPEDYQMQTPAAPLWYLARGTRVLYVRSAWGPDAFWAAFTSSPQINADHHHFDASSFVFTRAGDHLIIDPSTYGCRSTLPTNAMTADSTVVTGKYAPSQTPWGHGDLPWARATAPAVYAARADVAKAFDFSGKPSDIAYARREWAFLPEGEIVTIDRVNTGDAGRSMYVNFHTNTNGTLKMDGVVAVGTVGASQVAIHPVVLSGGSPAMAKPMVGENCYDGTCSNVRIPVDEYSVKVPGPFAVAIHVIDGLGATEERAQVGSLNDMNYDPMHENTGVIGAAVFRGMKQSYVVASSAQDGMPIASMTYSVPGGSSGRHVVYDAPEDGDGKSMVTAAVAGDRCSVSIVPGAGFAGHPLMFQVGAVADGCAVTENTDVSAGTPPPGGGSEVTVGTGGNPRPPGSTGSTGGDNGDGTGTMPGSGNSNALLGGCGCRTGRGPASGAWGALAGVAAILVASRRRRRR